MHLKTEIQFCGVTKIITFALPIAPVAELVDASVSKTDIREYVPVRFRPEVHRLNTTTCKAFACRWFIFLQS